jgi:hypothetical protein
MSKDSRTILGFAAVGLGIFVAWIVYYTLTDPSPWSPLNNILSVIFMILCPPVILTFPLLDVKIGSGGVYFLWTLVALLNAVLYAVIGSAYVRLRKKREGSAAS